MWSISLFTLILFLFSVNTGAHDVLRAFVLHKARLVIGGRHIDVTVDLTLFEDWSERERARMDADGNGRITKAEREAWLKQFASKLESQVRLRLAGRVMDLTPLYEPELELSADEKAGPGHLQLRLSFFAPTPATFRTGDEIVVEDALWPEAKALGTLEVEGRNGFELKVVSAQTPVFPPARQGETRVFKARLLETPATKPGD